MHRMDRSSPYVVAAVCVCFAAGGVLTQANGQAAAPALDYQFFKEKVEAVFLAKRPGHTRCFACHSRPAATPVTMAASNSRRRTTRTGRH